MDNFITIILLKLQFQYLNLQLLQLPATTHSAGINASQTSVTSTTSSTSTTPSTSVHYNSNTVPTIAREAHRSHTDLMFAPMTLVESLTKTNFLLVADMKGELQSIHNQLSTIPFEEIKNEQSQSFDKVNDRIESFGEKFY